MSKFKISLAILSVLIFAGCASYKTKIQEDLVLTSPEPDAEKLLSVYLMGDAGLASQDATKYSIDSFKTLIANQGTKDDVVIYLGDNIYPKGMPKKGDTKRQAAQDFIDVQVDAVSGFEGTTYFIPGNHDWYNKGPLGLKRQEEYVETALNNNDAFQPENGCPIETIELDDEVELIIIDTQWYLADWDKYPTINDGCEFKTRNEFFLELESQLKKKNEKTMLIAMHHPALTFGPHGGYFGAKSHLFPTGSGIPLPIIGSIVAQVRSTGGVSAQDRYNERYDELMDRLTTLVIDSDRAILLSGHEHTLQYIEANGVKQIVSGAGSKSNPVALGQGAQFVTGQRGYAVLDIYKDKSSRVKFYGMDQDNQDPIFSTTVYPADTTYDTSQLSSSFPATTTAKAYTANTDKSAGYKKAWGEHYRYVYGTNIEVPVMTIDKYRGGFTIERKGGGHQTRSLRLIDNQGRNFALRAVKKSAVQFLQSVVFKDTYVTNDFRNTLTEEALLDFYTASHPYAGFVVASLSDAIGLYHTNPSLVYMPKHKALGKYNAEYGDELYVIEERPDDGFLDVASFGKPDDIESTSDVLENLRKDEKYKIDEQAFIKARLFDMLIGDWDRHQDQWRWSRFDISEDKKLYRPIPRDRDQAFSNYDGNLLDLLKFIIPSVRQFQEYDHEAEDIKWLNVAGIKIDRAFIQNASKEVWLEQARFIQSGLSDQVIDAAFKKLPVELQDDTAASIVEKLKSRRDLMVDIASRYYDYLATLVVVTGTDKDDFIQVIRSDYKTTIKVSRIKDGEVMPPYKERIVYSDQTKEIWLYGLDDDDQIEVIGKGKRPIFTRIIGGQNNDVYNIENGRAVKVYDHGSKPNTIKKNKGAVLKFNDIYTNNLYDENKYIDKVNMIIPSIGFNPDDGVLVGISDTYTVKGFKQDPFYKKHSFRAGYYFATQGFDFAYRGEFANTFGNWNLTAAAGFASENFTQNFFGFGNDTANPDDELGLDYNRVKTGAAIATVGVVKTGHLGSTFTGELSFTRIDVQDTQGRFITEVVPGMPQALTGTNNFGTARIIYGYESSDNPATPTRGLFFKTKAAVTTNLDKSERTFGSISPSLEFYNALTNNRKLVLRTQAQGQFNIGDAFEFYQAANLGADNGLRGYRTERFSGESALAFSADLRWELLKFRTGIIPLKMNIFGGYDIGRVWVDGENSNTWHDSVGGGLIFNIVDNANAQFALFSSDDGIRFSFGFGFQF